MFSPPRLSISGSVVSQAPLAWRRAALLLLTVFVALIGWAATPPAFAQVAFTVRPVPGAVLAPFAAPPQPWAAGHRGVDLAASSATPVRAPADGVVTVAQVVVDRPVITLRHADSSGHVVLTSYEPVDAAVKVGDRVKAGQAIGWIGRGAHCSQRCLHWGLRVDGQYLDPLSWLAASVRLLPTDSTPIPLPAPPPRQILAPAASLVSSGGGIKPAEGPITSPFGLRYHPVLHVWKLHDGVDIGAPCGSPVRSVWGGTVVSVEHNIAWGNRVVIDHGRVNGHSVRTSYNHMSGFTVRPGQIVSAGGLVGNVGSTGYSTGCHLHLQLWLDGRIVDPLSVVGWR